MSLFPAYSNDKTVSANCGDTGNVATEWLSNSSFQTQIPKREPPDQFSSSDESLHEPSLNAEKQAPPETIPGCTKVHERPRAHKEQRIEKKRCARDSKRHKPGYELDVKNVYFEDRRRDKGNNNIDTFCSRVRPYYNVGEKSLCYVKRKQPKKDPCRRYYTRNIDSAETATKDTVIKRTSEKGASVKQQEDANESAPSWCKNLEEEQKSKTREYNKQLTEDPHNVELWLQYVDFQDTLAYYQRHQLAKDTHRSTVLKKLSIVEKALEKNADSTELLKLKLHFMTELTPSDELSNQLEALVNKDSGNLVLWQHFIMVTQASVAMCTVPRVLDLYSKCFGILRQRSRTNPSVYDSQLLHMLYQCLTFLRHTGLWEQMWETIRLNLNLNLNLNKASLSFRGSIDEKKLIGMEEVILMSRLPLNQLWQRTESLRENCHWISVNRDELELVGDSRRFIVPEDVADFVHPILSRNSNFQMAIYSILCLKVPLLPCRDHYMKELSLKNFHWGVESLEALLPFMYPMVGEMAGHDQRKELLKDVLEGRLTSGPQYLKFHPAQEPYLDFVRKTFHTIAESLPPLQRTSIYVWWLRLERLLVSLGKDESLKHDNKEKKLRATLKEFLKGNENRNNLYFYKEYALIELEMGRFGNCMNILETAIQSQGTCPSAITDTCERAALFNVYRTFIETLLDIRTYSESHRQWILKVFGQMVPGGNENQESPIEAYLHSCVQDFLQVPPNVKEKDTFFLSNLECDAIVCYVYFLYIKDGDIQTVVDTLRNCIDHSKDYPYLQEMLCESQIAILQLHQERTRSMQTALKETLSRTLNIYPNNFYALSVFAGIESELPTWRFNSRSTEIELWRAMAMCLAARRRIGLLAKLNHSDAVNAALNKLLSFHLTLSRLRSTHRCPLLWRLHMLLLREHNLCEKKGEEIYHQSVTQCPWARSVYIDAAEVAPQLLTQIQDLIREKELRMHVTPEELDILRG
ncbi:PREDICTED: protein NRDE2 homolog [Vollenhovia emeryi]|uniref:protein NRDE2 homolog n=1 Tax=Vollenhovia emeryi TaxID=411798 RepID=UPI0005F55CA0|nr:PREDICTED: protein NRDE2 homolog [Vollenhovia emeryi]XP_011862924.1 PREDICTED: protein NRDE2 homolog [Vollenhovia emeryi]